MKDFIVGNLVRKNIKNLQPYSAARSEYSGDAGIFLDANENAYGSPLDSSSTVSGLVQELNRYPDPLQWKLKEAIAGIKGVPSQNIFIGNGSDEVIDLAFRIFCEPGKDNVIICPPTYGMYKVCAHINDVAATEVNLTNQYQLDIKKILAYADPGTKLLFICSPNNPTGNNLKRIDIEFLLNNFQGLVIIDEAYINYSRQKTFLQELTEYENLIVMQTLSKAWGLAALRLGLAFASKEIIDLFNKVKPPYNINKASQYLGRKALLNIEKVNENIRQTVEQREFLEQKLRGYNFIKEVHPSDANFILIRAGNAQELYTYLAGRGIIVRNRSKEVLCENCIRITVGTPGENEILIDALKKYEHG